MSEWDRSSLNSRRSTLNSVTQSNYHPLQPIPRISSMASTSSHFTTVNKPFQCDVQGCTHERGFATQTDLKRHQRGVHAIYEDGGSSDTTYYRCQGKDCKDAGKTWPRRDNFRGHLARKHPEEEIEELTERYVKAVIRSVLRFLGVGIRFSTCGLRARNGASILTNTPTGPHSAPSPIIIPQSSPPYPTPVLLQTRQTKEPRNHRIVKKTNAANPQWR